MPIQVKSINVFGQPFLHLCYLLAHVYYITSSLGQPLYTVFSPLIRCISKFVPRINNKGRSHIVSAKKRFFSVFQNSTGYKINPDVFL